jgi:transketolase
MALGAILNRREQRFFCLTSDGELDEGSTWEAALFIAHRKLTNVVWLIDRNRIQALGGTEEVLALEPLDAKLEAFGFHVLAADGHDFPSLLGLRDQCTNALADAKQGRPLAIICNTIKGRGIRHMQDTVASHYLPMDDAQYSQALDELAMAHAAAMAGARDAG